jgi:hypothetical protein
MNRWQLIVMWVVGLYASLVFAGTGVSLMMHAKQSAETIETGYPFTVLAGTAWAYIIPMIIIGGLIFYTVRDNKK